jgi:hypothetical protein
MPKQHGLKKHFQVLLDPHRADLLVSQAEANGVPAAAYAREMLYEALRRTSSTAAYALAEAMDAAARKEGVVRQVSGRVEAIKQKKALTDR